MEAAQQATGDGGFRASPWRPRIATSYDADTLRTRVFNGEGEEKDTLSQKAPVGLVLDLILLLKNIRIQDHIFIA